MIYLQIQTVHSTNYRESNKPLALSFGQIDPINCYAWVFLVDKWSWKRKYIAQEDRFGTLKILFDEFGSLQHHLDLLDSQLLSIHIKQSTMSILLFNRSSETLQTKQCKNLLNKNSGKVICFIFETWSWLGLKPRNARTEKLVWSYLEVDWKCCW